MPFSLSRSAISSGSAARASAAHASSNAATIGLVVGIVGHLLVARDSAARITRWPRFATGTGEWRVDRHTFGQYHIDAASGVDLDHREGLLGERDVVLGQTIHGVPHAGAHASLEGVGGVR